MFGSPLQPPLQPLTKDILSPLAAAPTSSAPPSAPALQIEDGTFLLLEDSGLLLLE